VRWHRVVRAEAPRFLRPWRSSLDAEEEKKVVIMKLTFKSFRFCCEALRLNGIKILKLSTWPEMMRKNIFNNCICPRDLWVSTDELQTWRDSFISRTKENYFNQFIMSLSS
jgi:hypothetical protein